MVELRLLGPVEVCAGGRPLAVGVPQRQTVLAALAVDAGRVVTRDQLVDRVWNGRLPARVDAAVYAQVTHLRRLLDQVNAVEDRATPAAVDRVTGGYLLRVDTDEVDLCLFRRRVAAARDPACAADDRVRLLREALALWRGSALAGLSGDWVTRVRDGWAQERLDAVLAWAEAELLLDNPSAVVGLLTELAAGYPLAEPVAAALMRAQVATGKRGDALDEYTRIRLRLADQLGVDPGPELQAVHQSILRGDLDPALPTPQPVVVPAQLPADVSAFTGRDRELAQLDALLPSDPAIGGAASEDQASGGGPMPVVISAVAGTAGVGKTALAIRWAHRERGRFPDGQLYVDLRGYDPNQPAVPAEVLADFLDALGVPHTDIPSDLDARAARFRTETADRRLLIVLDNASSVEQVRPLLPGTGSSVVLVTSRDSLAGLVALQGAQRIDLDRLPAADAGALLRQLVGPRVDAEPAAAATLASQCAYLPLALRIAAELAVSRPTASLADLVAELADRQRRLELLDAGDPRAAVRAVFSWSIRHIPDDAARTFGLLGLHPGPCFDEYVLAAFADTTLTEARRTLDRLVRAHLVQPARRGRYVMHDLLRAYAAELAMIEESDFDRHVALTRLFDYFLATAAAAVNQSFPADADNRPAIPPAATPTPEFTEAGVARAWLDTERCNLAAIAEYAANSGRHAYAIRLSAILFRYLDGRYHANALSIHGHARDAARETGDRAAEARALSRIAATKRRLGQHAESAEDRRRALELLRQLNDPAGQARAPGNLGMVEARRGKFTTEPAEPGH